MPERATIKVPLTRGYSATIDDGDAWILEHKWFASVRRGGRVYAVRSFRGSTILMHRAVLGSVAEGLHVDHIDGDSLNNTRANLRAVTPRENHRNIKSAHANSKSGVMGVYLCRRTQRWAAEIKIDNRKRWLGYFDTIDDATAARLAAEREAWGVQPRRAGLHADAAPAPTRSDVTRANTSGHRGVSFCNIRKKWITRKFQKGRVIFLGSFIDKSDAIAARQLADNQRLASPSGE